MSVTHGINGSLTWTEAGGEGNADVYEANVYKIVLNQRRRMADVTPLSWNSQEWAPGQYRWTAELHAYMPIGQDPGWFNDTIASATFTTNTVGADNYAGSVWIEGLRIEMVTDDATRVVFLVRGTGNISATF